MATKVGGKDGKPPPSAATNLIGEYWKPPKTQSQSQYSACLSRVSNGDESR